MFHATYFSTTERGSDIRKFRCLQRKCHRRYFYDFLSKRRIDLKKKRKKNFRYTECTSAEIQSLRLFMELYPGHRGKEIEASIEKGARFIESRQLADGS
ncbi:hypothetical protein RJ639_046985, partial [Escallonia herrerae]